MKGRRKRKAKEKGRGEEKIKKKKSTTTKRDRLENYFCLLRKKIAEHIFFPKGVNGCCAGEFLWFALEFSALGSQGQGMHGLLGCVRLRKRAGVAKNGLTHTIMRFTAAGYYSQKLLSFLSLFLPFHRHIIPGP